MNVLEAVIQLRAYASLQREIEQSAAVRMRKAHGMLLGADRAQADAARRHAARYEEAARHMALLAAALERLLAEPHGCRFCDSGTLRRPGREHDRECGYAMARRALQGLP